MPKLCDLFWESERRAARPPERVSVSDWADRHRVLDPINCAQPGKWRTEFAPFLRGIMDAFSDPLCEDIILMGGTQWGKTESMINMLLWSLDQDPKPTLFVMPTEEDVVSFGNRRLRHAIEYCPTVNDLRSDWKTDTQRTELAFADAVVYLGWSTSPSKLASRSIGHLFCDEVDKYPRFTGREADPISLATERLRWYHDRKRVIASTPTTADGYIYQLWLGSDQRWYLVPCPFCCVFQRLTFSRETVVWPEGERDPEKIQRERLASYRCEKCKRDVPDDQISKRRMLSQGVWCPDGASVDAGGRVRGNTDGRVRGFHVNALYSPVLTFSDVAAQFLKSKVSEAKLLNFTNSWTGWPWLEKKQQATIERLRAIEIRHQPEGTCPDDTIVVTAGCDTKKDEIHYAIRAWQPNERSCLVRAGTCRDLDILDQILWGSAIPTAAGKKFRVRLACIDSGYRTDEVYRWCAEHGDRARPIKGQVRQKVPILSTRIDRDWVGRPVDGLLLWSIDTHYLKDRWARMVQVKSAADTGAWRLHDDTPQEYLEHLLGEHVVLVRHPKTKQLREEWLAKPGVPNHWLDCEVYNLACAEMLSLWAVKEEPTPAMQLALGAESTDQGPSPERPERTGFIRKRGQFIRKRGR